MGCFSQKRSFLLPHEFSQYIHDQGIELSARSHPQNSQRDVIPQGSIACLGNLNSLECVGDGENSRAERNEFPPDAIWVSRSIPMLVVMRNQDRRVAKE